MSQLKICPQCGSEYELDQRFCPRDGTTLRTQSGGQDLVGEIIADRYHVLKKLGEGGMGQVYLAEHVKMGRKSAVKVMNPGMVHDADAISRFNREASNASRINHPNVAAIYDFGETADGIIYLAMEFVEGEPLTKLVERLGALPAPRAADITRQAAEALAVAHDMGIVHRDLKPDNIMLARNRDGSDCVKVVDFGIAKAADSAAQKVTKTGLVVGTPEYMSPEQLAGDKLDGRSDIYSLALVAFNMLTGKLPFPAETVQEAMIMRLTDRPRRLEELRPETAWPAELQAVLDRALARDAADRYQSASEFGRDLVRAVDHMPMTRAAELGTAVLTAVPPTRVAPATPAGAPASATLASAPARPSPAAPPVAAPAASRPRRPLVLALVALGVVAALGGGLYATLDGKAAPPVTSDTAQPSASVTSSQSLEVPTASPAATSSAPVAGSAPLPSAPVSNPATTPTRRETVADAPVTPSFDPSSELRTIGRLVESSDKASLRDALLRVDELLPKLRSRADSTEALFHKATAFGGLDDTPDRACAILARLKSQTPSTRFTAAAADSYGQICQ